VSTGRGRERGGARDGVDGWAAGRTVLRAADPRMAALVEADPDLERLRTLDDDAARTELTQVKGVGRFTADGVLMLALRRPDVWPAADLALRRAVERVWGLDAPATVAEVDALGERFRPWRTLAAVYLYRSLAA
jgi:DNA-3-methyladenine glycosylase II